MRFVLFNRLLLKAVLVSFHSLTVVVVAELSQTV